MTSWLGSIPGSSPYMNPGFDGFGYTTVRSQGAYANQYLPSSPGEISPVFMPRDPTKGALESLVTLGDGATIVTLPKTIMFVSASTSQNSVLYTQILPMIETGQITTFLKEYKRYPAMPIRHAAELSTPHYLHRSSWQTATTTFRWNIGNRYAMEATKTKRGQEQMAEDAAQIAMSFQQHFALLAIDGLKMAHRPLLEQRRHFGQFDTNDLLYASEFQVTHFCAVQKTTHHGWTNYITAVKDIMRKYDGEPTTLVTDVKIKASFLKKEYTQFLETGEPSLNNVRNPASSMSRATPTDNIIYLEFIPERLATKQSPMHEFTQIGGWHPGFDVPHLVNSTEYAENYESSYRTFQIYDQELDSFADVTLYDMLQHSHMFGADTRKNFKKEIFGIPSDGDATFVSELFDAEYFKNETAKRESNRSVVRASADAFLKSLAIHFAKSHHRSVHDVSRTINDGVELYVRMSKADFDVNYMHEALANTVANVTNHAGKSTNEIVKELVDAETSTMKLNLNHSLVDNKHLDKPVSALTGFLSWRGWVALYDLYNKQPRTEKDKADREWTVLVEFVKTIKDLARFESDYLPTCGLFHRIKYAQSHPFSPFEKTKEESIVDQLFNFNATFPVLLHKQSFQQWGLGAVNKTDTHFDGAAVDVFKNIEADAAAIGAVAGKTDVNTNERLTKQLAVIYDRLIHLNFSSHLNYLRKVLSEKQYKIVIATISAKAITPKTPNNDNAPLDAVLPNLPEVTSVELAKNNTVTFSENARTDIVGLKKDITTAMVNDVPHVSRYHWLTTGKWVMSVLLNYLAVVYTRSTTKNDSNFDQDLTQLSDAVVNVLNTTPLSDLKITVDNGDIQHGADVIDAVNQAAAIKLATFTNGKTFTKIYEDVTNPRILLNASGVLFRNAFIASANKLWMYNFEQKKYEDAAKAKLDAASAAFKTFYAQYTPASVYDSPTDEPTLNTTNASKHEWFEQIPIISKLPDVIRELQGKVPDVSEQEVADDVVKNPNVGKITAELMKILKIGHDDPSNFENVPYYGGLTRMLGTEQSDLFTDSDPKDNYKPMAWRDDASMWVRTPFRISAEQLHGALDAGHARNSGLELRVEYVRDDDRDRALGGHPFGSSILVSNASSKKQLYSKKEVEKLTTDVQNKSFSELDWKDLPFLKAEDKCNAFCIGKSLKDRKDKHYHDMLFGIRMLEDEDRASRATNAAWKLLKAVNPRPSHFDLLLGMMCLCSAWTKDLAELFVAKNVIFPIDFICFRPWMNYLTVLGFLLKPGVDNLGFISISHADKMTSSTAMDKTGILHCSVWGGVVFNNPANVKKMPNLACIGFGAGGGSGFYALDEIQDHVSHKTWTPVQRGTTSNSIVVAAIPKGSMPKRTMLSLIGRLPGDSYADDNFVLNESEKIYSNENILHYPTAKYYANFWNINASSKSVGQSLNMDQTSTGNNIICFLGTTKLYNPKSGGYDIIILNTGHFGVDEGPGCKTSRSTGGPIPETKYTTDPAYKTITI